jgi:hypothetical protein
MPLAVTKNEKVILALLTMLAVLALIAALAM